MLLLISYLLGLTIMWVVNARVIMVTQDISVHDDVEDIIFAIGVGFVAAIIWPLTLIGLIVYAILKKMEEK